MGCDREPMTDAEPTGAARTLLTRAVREDLDHAVLCWLATVDEDMVPNVSPKEIFCSHGDDALLIANIASPGSMRNIARNPKVCVSFIDVFRQRGFKLIGRATVIPRSAPDFSTLAEGLLRKAGPDFPVHDAIHVRIERVERIWAPSYRLFPDRSVEERMQSAFAAYGVRPSSPDGGV